ncbi:(Fe-S)-binding protein [Kingella negevensis]|uniref:(Fe-S)-binding protein n=1 Tax=Kingella negevensis TaxID=1522312 RepID=UPI00050A197E|nr:(Fe-S)-binding protein [Kingella negevensis]MDK4688795.1 (Fe-S)-binding protein [Kingella negevensis]WII90080.1 (Fe-S)-binding protein [Kingella negevensis]WII94207.1 (Fe-S)-binding protein [Kingella negevensis]
MNNLNTPPMDKPSDVYFFGTCVVDMIMPEAGMDAMTLLEQQGITVHFPMGQSCCGQPAYSSGHPKEAFEVAKAQLDLFPENYPIVVPSGSCGGMMKHHWPNLFKDSEYESRAKEVAGRIVEFTNFLVAIGYQPVDKSGDKIKVAVHTSCAARREMGVHNTGWKLIDSLENVERVVHDHESECCGFGGTFSVKHPDIAGAMVTDKVAALKDTQAVEIVSADCGCMLNIGGKIAKDEPDMPKPKHIATFLLERTGGKA